VIADSHHAKALIPWILAIDVSLNLDLSYLVIIVLRRSAKLRCSGSTPLGASTYSRKFVKNFCVFFLLAGGC
jgi:hypothetical protein